MYTRLMNHFITHRKIWAKPVILFLHKAITGKFLKTTKTEPFSRSLRP